MPPLLERRAARLSAACTLAVVLAAASALIAPEAARADPPTLGLPPLELQRVVPERLGVLPATAVVALAVRARAAEEQGTQAGGGQAPPAGEADRSAEKDRAGEKDRAPSAEKPSLDFDLLGAAQPPPVAADSGELRLRRKMLTLHQGIGLGLVGLQLATTAVGQLNYSDRFPAGPDTARYKAPHQILAYTTLGVFLVNGAVALLAPSAKTPKKLDRVMVHRIAMFTAAAGMAAQGVLGIQTRQHLGRLDQERLATRHLVVGYATLAAVLTGVGVIVF
jgi:hypothetical protein